MKSLLIASSFLILSIASIFTTSEINVTFNAPSSIIAGESFIMDIEIDKGDISDFAKLQLSLPEGFSAELFEGKEGTFTFYDQKIKLIWISLPTEPKFHVKLKIACDTSLVGDYNFKGKISYVLEGERKNKELISPIFKIMPKSKPASPTITSTSTNDEIVNENSLNSAKTDSELSCSRSFDAIKIEPGKTFLVTLKVEKSNVSGVGKIIENIPDGFTAQEVENNGAIFSQKGNQVKFLWMTLPSDNEFTVSYKIMVDENLGGNKVIDGKMSYLDGDATKNALIIGTSIEITNTIQDLETAGIEQNSNDETTTSAEEEKTTHNNNTSEKAIGSDEEKESVNNTDREAITDQKPSSTENQTETKNTNAENTIASNDKTKSNQVANKAENNTTSLETNNTSTEKENTPVDNTIATREKNNTLQNETATSIDNTTATIQDKNAIQTENNNTNSTNDKVTSNHKVNYRVQICALRKKTETNYFVQNHNVKEKIYLNMHEGWHKYTVGDFKEYMAARDHRSNAKSNYKINGSFVTAYNDGSRITVQEALMITKDKWIAP